MVAAAAATSFLSLYSAQAFADTNANGVAADSPGVLSGNSVQAPVNVPVNVCGNSVDVVAALNPAFGNSCENASDKGKHRKPDTAEDGASSGHGSDHGDGSSAHGATHGSPGVLSGNNAQVPVDVPVNACGNSVDVIGLLNPAFGNECANHSGPKGYGDDTPPTKPPTTKPPRTTPPTTAPPTTAPPTRTPPKATPPQGTGAGPQLAHTGSEGLLAASAASAGLLIGGAVLYRRGRATSHR